jgi:branched-chain amino acid transport system ATP-binding protein
LANRTLLEMKGVSAGYGKMEILHEVSLRVDAGEIVTIVGPNGAGKSTALKTIMGYLHPSAGRVLFGTRDIAGRPVHENVIGGVGYVPQGRVTFAEMTVVENLEMGAFFVRDHALVSDSLDLVFGLFPRLAERRRQLAGTMSGGEQQMVSIGRALMGRPKCVLLDEPSLGLSPKFVDVIFAKLREMRALGMALLMVEQNAVRALNVSDRGYVLDLGRNYCDGTGKELLGRDDIRRLFVGA